MVLNLIAGLRQRAFSLVLIISAAAIPLLATHTAEASLYVCRGDPILKLNDGMNVTLTVDLTIPASRVVSVAYSVHAPRLARLNSVTYQADDLAGKESVVMLNDSTDGLYHISVLVAALPGAPGTAQISGLNKDTLLKNSGPIGEPISIVLSSHS